jgi:pSer/pThr/pTyr-binding forkhead associated (FHA) protein
MQVEICITTGPTKGQCVLLDKPGRFSCGRSLNARVSLPNDPYVSNYHALFEILPSEECKITDLDSKNGIVVNGIRYGGEKPPKAGIAQALHGMKEVQLKNGDEITVGDTSMEVKIQLDTVQNAMLNRLLNPEKQKIISFSTRKKALNSTGKRALKSLLYRGR